jgi:hypothetical protein
MAAQRPGGNVTRRQFVTGVGGAAVGGLAVGGAGGFFGGRASKSTKAGGAAQTGGGGTITVGAGIPVTGAFSGDGQEMRRGLELGVEAINARGGIFGRKLELSFLDSKEQQADVMKSVVRKFVSDKVAAIFIPFCTYQNAEFPIAAQSKIPTFHVNTFQGERGLGARQQRRQHLPGRSEPDLVRAGVRPRGRRDPPRRRAQRRDRTRPPDRSGPATRPRTIPPPADRPEVGTSPKPPAEIFRRWLLRNSA